MGEMRSAVWFAEEREGTKKNFMSFSFEFQIFFAAPFDFAFAVSERASERARGSSEKGRHSRRSNGSSSSTY